MLGVVVATEAPSSRYQKSVIRYEDNAGQIHEVAIRFPLGLGERVIPGYSTTIAYDPESPARAEMANHHRHHWQDVAFSAALTAGVTGLWLFLAVSLSSSGGLNGVDGRDTTRGAGMVDAASSPRNDYGSEYGRSRGAGQRDTTTGVVAAAVLLAGARIGLGIVGGHPVQDVPFPALPPPPVEGTEAVTLPAVLRAPPPASGPLVTPEMSREVFKAAWPLRDRALADRDVATLRQLESGDLLAADLSDIHIGAPPHRPFPDGRAPSVFETYVPRQTTWPVRFLALAITTGEDRPVLESLVFARTSADVPWHVVLVNDIYANDAYAPEIIPAMVDDEGYNIVPSTPWIDPPDVAPAIARYWQSWLDRGRDPESGPSFGDGYWTSRFVNEFANQQGKRDPNGLIGHVHYSTERTPDAQVWSFGLRNYRLVCAAFRQTNTWDGPAHQDRHRQKWGPELAPGVYRTVTAESVRMPCTIVPVSPGPLGITGADKRLIATHGERQ